MLRTLFLARSAIVLTAINTLAAERDPAPASLVGRFDALVVPATAKSLKQPLTDQGGTIAWGESYQLSALVEMLAATRDAKYAKSIVELSEWIAKCRDDQHGRRDEIRGEAVAAWSSTNYTKGIRYAWAVHTGMIVAPMARFAAVVRGEPTLRIEWGADADRLLKVAQEAVAVHDTEYRDGPGEDEGYVYCPYLKKHLPLNMQNALARAWLAIDDATGEPKHRDRVKRMARFLKNRMRSMEDGASVWAYWPPLEGTAETFEDVSHASINVDFMVLCFEHDLVFNREDLVRVQTTLLKRVLMDDGRISDTVGGGDRFDRHRAGALRWARLGRHFPAVHARLVELSESADLRQRDTSVLQGLAYLSLPPVTASPGAGP